MGLFPGYCKLFRKGNNMIVCQNKKDRKGLYNYLEQMLLNNVCGIGGIPIYWIYCKVQD
jgi:hypothetical protein